MGVIAKQSIRGTIVTYLGIAVGIFTTFVVLTRFLTQEEIGFFQKDRYNEVCDYRGNSRRPREGARPVCLVVLGFGAAGHQCQHHPVLSVFPRERDG